MAQETLFEGSEPTPKPDPLPVGGRPRFHGPDRTQGCWDGGSLDDLLTPDHRAREVWSFVESLDLTAFYRTIRAVEAGAGRTPIDPAILLALWLYATVEGIGSARALARLCESHMAYRWLCGGVSVNHHTLSDFRGLNGERLDALLTSSVASMLKEGIVTLTRVSQDGVRVRAAAGASSLRGKDALGSFLTQAREQVETLKRELEEDPSGTSVRQAAARTRAARERKERVERAIAVQKEIEEGKRTEEDKGKARASTTDADARVMKMADGGFRPALNVQIAAGCGSQIVLGVSVDSSGVDAGHLTPMLSQIQERFGVTPTELLADGGYVSEAEIERAAAQGTTTYAPVRVHTKAKDPEKRHLHRARAADCEAVGRWRERMGTHAAKEIYKERAATSECVNAQMRNRGRQRFLVRGLAKARAVMLLFALAHNLMRAASIRAGLVPLAA